MNNKQARILKEPVAYFKVLSWNAPIETDSSDTKIIMIMIIISASDSPTETQSEYLRTRDSQPFLNGDTLDTTSAIP
jgi:hypothetical protein